VNKKEFVKQLESDISENVALQNTVKKSFGFVLTIIIFILSLSLAIYYKVLEIWAISSFLMWGIYAIYSLFNITRINKKKLPKKLNFDQQVNLFLQLTQPLNEGAGLFFLISFLILLFGDMRYKIFLLIYSGSIILTAIFLLFSHKLFLTGFDALHKMQNIGAFFNVKGKKRIFRIIVFIIAILLIVSMIYLAPILLIILSIKLIILYKIKLLYILIALPVQLITLFYFAGYLSSRNTIYRLKNQLYTYKNIKDQLVRTSPTKTQLKIFTQVYEKEKALKLISLNNFLKIDITVLLDTSESNNINKK
jgi:hypothetical protein